MRLRFLCSFLVGVALFLSGCGSSGSGGNHDGNSTTVTFTFDTAGPMPSVVATRTGSGAFTPATLSSNVLTVSVPAGTAEFAVAYLCPTYPYSYYQGGIQYGYNSQYVVEASTADWTSYTAVCEAVNLGSFSVDVNATGTSGAQGVLVETGNHSRSRYYYSDQSLSESSSYLAPVGSDTSFAEAYSGSVSSDSFYALAVKRFDAPTVPGSLNRGNVVTLGPADLTSGAAITYQNLPAGFTPGNETYFDPSAGGTVRLAFSSGTALVSYPQLPAAAVESGDTYELSAYAWNDGSGVGEIIRNQGGAAAVQYPTPWSYSGPAAAALPTFDYSSYSGFTDAAKVTRDGNISWSPSSQVIDDYHIAATANAMNGSNSLTMPDLSAAGGFLAGPASGTSVTWYAEITENSAGALVAMSSGATKYWVENAGSLIVP